MAEEANQAAMEVDRAPVKIQKTVDTKSDGTKTETLSNPDGKVVKKYAADGSVISTRVTTNDTVNDPIEPAARFETPQRNWGNMDWTSVRKLTDDIYGTNIAAGSTDPLDAENARAVQAFRLNQGAERMDRSDSKERYRRARNARLDAQGPAGVDPNKAKLLQLRVDTARHKLNKAKNPEAKDLNTTERKRFDNVEDALSGIEEMDKALAAGQNTFSLIGDNDFTRFRDQYVDAITRMQTGATMSDREELFYARNVPTTFDSIEIQRDKLSNLYDRMKRRRNSFGNKVPKREYKTLKYAKKLGAGPTDYDTRDPKDIQAELDALPPEGGS